MASQLPHLLLVIAVLLIVISAVQPIARRLALSDSVLLAVVGTLIGGGAVFVLETPRVTAFDGIAAALVHLPIGSEAFLFVFLPLLVFHGALSIDVRRLARDAAPVLMMAVVAVLVSTAAVGFALAPLTTLPLAACLMLGAIVATTDPSAVVAVFREIGADGRLTRLVEGESLLNDAAAISIFAILMTQLTDHELPSVLGACWILVSSLAVGLAIGFVMARAMLYAVPLLGGSRAAEVSLTLALPYVAYITCDEFLHASGVVAAAAAGLTVSAIGPSTFRPHSWAFLTDIWAQLAFWASSMVFILASMLVPKLMIGTSRHDLLLLAVVIAAALAARAVVLFGLLPLLTRLGLSQRVPTAFRVTMLWGGLRGAITLALALSVTENDALSPEIKHFVAILATGFVLASLLAGGTTLGLLVGWLHLDRLPAIDQALRHQVVAIGLGEARDRVRQSAAELGFARGVTQRVLERFTARIEHETGANEFDSAITDRDRITLGLITLASQERSVLLEMFKDRALPRSIMEHLLWTAESMIDGARSGGRLGYIRAARRRLRPGLRFALAQWLHRSAHIDAPLMNRLAERFEMLLLMRLVVASLTRFMRRRMEPVLGQRVSEIVAEILERRRETMEDAAETLRVQYPGYAEALELRVLQLIGMRMETDAYDTMRRESLIGDELHEELLRALEERRDHLSRPLKFSLQIGLDTRLREIPLLSGLQEAVLHDVAMNVTVRFVIPGEAIVRRGRRARAVFFISSGSVDVTADGATRTLGRGEFFGATEVLEHSRRRIAVRARSFSHLIELRGAEFRRLVDENPELLARLDALRALRTPAEVGEDGPLALIGFEPAESKVEAPPQTPPKAAPLERIP
ncbi:MAG: cation:proton antiporter [Janthinobacterium lividum]